VKLYDTITGIAVHPDVDLNSPYKKLSDEEIAKLPPDDAYFKTPRKDSWAAEVLAGKMELADLPAADAGQSVKADESLLDNPPDRIKGLAHRILSQSIIEDAAMKKLLREKIDIGDEHLELMFGDGFPLEEGMATGGGGGGGGGGAAAAAEPVKEKDAFDVKLAAVDAKAKIKIIKEVRTITGLGLKEAKELVEKAPVVIKQGVSKDEAAELEKVLKGVGAEVELV
jgi:large subunit ribosomal protein L7/L12